MAANQAFQPYLSRLVRYWDEDAPGCLHRSIDGSMVFVDISGFTAMSERLARYGNVGAEEVTEVIDSTFGLLLPEAYNFGANLVKFGGDAMLLLFTGEGHAPRAAAGAFAMRAKLRGIGAFETTAGKVNLRMSVGAHSGGFDFFLVGDSHREFVVAGPAATRTVEMEGAAGTNQILISPEMAARLPSQVVGPASGPGHLLRREPQVDDLGFRQATSPSVDLAQFIPVALRESLAVERVDPEHRPSAVAFLHYEGFDRLLAQLGGEAAGAILDRLVATVQRAGAANDVTFLATDIAPDGGKIILTSGVPHTRGNDTERMLLALRSVLDQAPSDLPVRIGVNWGPVFSGVVGPGYRRTFTVMGDVVNLAARLMGKAPAGEMYTTEDVVASSRTVFAVSRPEPFMVKGKSAPIQALSIGRPEGTRHRDTAADFSLIGRDRELKELAAAWESTRTGRGRVVEIAAEVGMGKSRLLEAFIEQAAPSGLIQSESRLYQAATPYFPFRALLREIWDLDSPDETENVKRLRQLVADRAPSLEPWLALLGAPADLEIDESPEVAQLEDQFRPARTLAGVRTLLEATLLEPVVLMLEDSQWMDDASAELLGGLIQGMEDQAWMIIVTRQPGKEGFTAPDLNHCSRLELDPLSPDDARRFIIDVTVGDPLLPHLVEQLVRRAEGRPLFLLELINAIRSGGSVDSLPSSVEGLIGSRIDRLSPIDRSVLRRLAVLGPGFRLEYTRAVLRDGKGDEPRQALARLGDFLTADKAGWIQFRNALIREVAYQGLPYKTRLELHTAVADSILRSAGADPNSEAALLSLHYYEARRWREAWRYSRVAGEAARSVYANQTAATFFRRAITAGRHVDELDAAERRAVAIGLGDVLEQAGLYDDALDAYRSAFSHTDESEGTARSEILLKRAQVKIRKAAYAPALSDVTTGLKLLRDESGSATELRAALLALRSTVRMAQQRPVEALAVAERAAAAASESGEQAALARAFAIMDWAYFVTGQADKATNSARAVEIYESLGQLDKAADVINNMGGFAYYMGNWNESIERISPSRDVYLRAGNDVQAAMAGANLGELLVSQGKLTEAEPVLEDSLRVLQAAGNQDDAINAELQLARLWAEANLVTKAIEALTRVRTGASKLGQGQIAFEAALYAAACQIKSGQAEEALVAISEAAQRVGDEGEFFEPKRARIAAEGLMVLGRSEEAWAELESGLVAALEMGLVFEEAMVRSARLELASRLGRSLEADEADTTHRLLDRLGIEQAAAVV